MINVNGVTFLAGRPHRFEGAGSIYQSCLFTYIVSILFNLKYYHYSNVINPLGEVQYEVIGREQYEVEWEQIFGLFSANSTKLRESFWEEIIVNYKFLEKYSDINYPVVANLDFRSAHDIVVDNWEIYKEKIYPFVIDSFRKKNTYNPDVVYMDSNFFNIAIHLRVHTENDLPVDKNIAWQNFNLNHSEKLNTSYYSKLYAALINYIVKAAKEAQNKTVVVHIFSRGNATLFDELSGNLLGIEKLNLHLNTKAADAFCALTTADYLVGAHSSFSWLASHLNPNPSFFRSPFRQILSPNGHFFDDEFRISKMRLIPVGES